MEHFLEVTKKVVKFFSVLKKRIFNFKDLINFDLHTPKKYPSEIFGLYSFLLNKLLNNLKLQS